MLPVRRLAVLGLAVGMASYPSTSNGTSQTASGVSLETKDAGASQSSGETEAMVAMGKAAVAECKLLEPSLCYQRAFELLAADGGALEAEQAYALVVAACGGGFRPSCGAITPPKAIWAPLPEYTEAARRKRVEGIVLVRCTVPVDGRPRDCRFMKSLPEMDDSVKAALASARYEPATVLGRPVRSDFVFSFKFKLH
jgi:TonB family protein